MDDGGDGQSTVIVKRDGKDDMRKGLGRAKEEKGSVEGWRKRLGKY